MYSIFFTSTEWTSRRHTRTIFHVPFSIDNIGCLGDYDSSWSIGVRCSCCQHTRQISAVFLIRLYGRRTSLEIVVPRLYCSSCMGRGCCAGKDFEVSAWIPR